MAINNLISFGSAKAVELKDEYKSSVQTCRQIVLKNIPKLVEYLFEKSDDRLYEMAEKATSNTLQTTYFDAMRELRLTRESIENHFNTSIMQRFEQFWREGPSVNMIEEPIFSLSEENISLIDNDELEESLAINNMIAKGDSLFYRELYALDQRFGHMLGGVNVDDGSNPVSPAVVAYTFREALAGVDVDLPVKLLIYKLFEQEVIAYLGAVYDQMNDYLAGAGVVPKLHRQAKRNPVSPALRRSETHEETAQREVDEAAEVEAGVQAELFLTLQRLLDLRRGQSDQQRHAPDSRVPVYKASEVLQALTSLQHKNPIRDSAQVGATLYDIRTGLETNLKSLLVEGEERRVDRVDEDAIDVISMLFEFILDDRNLHEAMKAQLACLQIPMLKVAILDKQFFSSKTHSARRLLNALAQAAVGWTEANGREPGGVFDRVSKTVKRIVDEFDNDVSLFENLYNEFDEFLKAEQKSANIAETRATQVTQGKEQLSQAKQQVFEELNRRIAQHPRTPDLVSTFLLEGWKDVMLLIGLRNGTESVEWKNALTLADELIWSVEPKPEHRDRQQLLKKIPTLLKGIRQGLNNISYNQHQMTELFKKLQSYHVRCLRGMSVEPGSGAIVEKAKSATAVAENVKSNLGRMAEGAVTVDPYFEQAQNIAIGSWLEMTREDGEKYRAKLSWRSNVTGICLFVNRKGMKVAELKTEGLAMLLREGNAVLLGKVEQPLMDRAMDAMLKVLKTEKATASS